MSSIGSSQGHALEVSVVIAARPETIFRFLAEPARFSQWVAAKADFEPTAGGTFSIDFPECNSRIQGKILAFEENRHLAFSWGEATGPHQQEMPVGSTRVDITLTPHVDGTLVTLGHTGLPSTQLRDEHTGGWKHYLVQLSLHSTREQLEKGCFAAVQKHFAAWNESSPSRRMRLLCQAWDANGRFADRYALVQGVEELNRHITGALKLMPGMKFEQASEVQLCHGSIRFDWRVVDPNGNSVFAGTDFGEVSLDGRLKRLVGFWE